MSVKLINDLGFFFYKYNPQHMWRFSRPLSAPCPLWAWLWVSIILSHAASSNKGMWHSWMHEILMSHKPGFKFWLYHSAVWPWASVIAFQSLCFLFYKTGILTLLHCLGRIILDDAWEIPSIIQLGVLLPHHELGNKIALQVLSQ